MKNYLMYCFAAIVILVGCTVGDSGKKTDTTLSETVSTDKANPSENSVCEILLGKKQSGTPTFNPAANELAILCRKGRTYSLYCLETGDIWSPCQSKWTVKKGCTLDNFVFTSSGALYAVEKKPAGKKKFSHTFVRLYNNGKRKSVNLQGLDKLLPEIQDIQFSGNTAAILFADNKVRFYNIKEGAALGANITGTPGRSVFHNKDYITVTRKHSRLLYNLNFTDIRFGENIRTITLKPAANSDACFLTHYHDSLYFLCGDGIYGGEMKEKSLPLLVSYASLELPSSCRVTSLIAARDDKLYITWLDEKKKMHLQYCMPQKSD